LTLSLVVSSVRPNYLLPTLERGVKLPESEDLPSIKELEDKIKKAKKKSLGGEKEVFVSSPSAMHVSVDLLAGVIGGAFAGYYLDKWLGTLPVFFIACFFLGIAGAARNIMRELKNADKAEK
jgi:ATP synthase protein I